MLKRIVLLSIVIIVILLEIRVYYNYFLNKYFRNGDKIVYDYFLVHFIHYVSKNNYFMNYGLWDKNNNNLKKANKNLCNFIFNQAKINSTDKFTILDVGCGYGKQDLLLEKMLSNDSKITAIDLSKTQVDFANKYRAKKKISKKRLNFIDCDAHYLTDKFHNRKFNRILSIESAFHYKDKGLFFNNVSELLEKDGLFVISDIILADTYQPTFMRKMFLNIASDFLCIPEKNFIKMIDWKKQVEDSKLKVIKIHDITQKTFIPYYKYFFTKYIENKKLPSFISDIMIYYFNSVQPFTYFVAVCSKKDTC
jgi:2-polyprenyl-3-methyl-5-hydroxy-6-metoxy-1,4-benzoquinol methylase